MKEERTEEQKECPGPIPHDQRDHRPTTPLSEYHNKMVSRQNEEDRLERNWAGPV